jgi:hypothetical protein
MLEEYVIVQPFLVAMKTQVPSTPTPNPTMSPDRTADVALYAADQHIPCSCVFEYAATHASIGLWVSENTP